MRCFLPALLKRVHLQFAYVEICYTTPVNLISIEQTPNLTDSWPIFELSELLLLSELRESELAFLELFCSTLRSSALPLFSILGIENSPSTFVATTFLCLPTLDRSFQACKQSIQDILKFVKANLCHQPLASTNVKSRFKLYCLNLTLQLDQLFAHSLIYLQ